MQPVDLRSDTVTRPTVPMLDAMRRAPLGDDVFEEDPTIQALEAKVAELLGQQAALFCPSGTMANQIAINVHTRPLDELICASDAHVTQYEGGGPAFNSGVSVKGLSGDRGRLTAGQIESAINPDDVHKPVTRLICLENTCNRGGGSIYDPKAVREIVAMCKRRKLGLHLDGARLFNAAVASSRSVGELSAGFDSVSVCLSKGLGAPVGSVVVGSVDFVHRARRVRKALGGGMRQAGLLAAAGIYALDHHVDRLADDHRRAQQLFKALDGLPFVAERFPVETNIVIFRLTDDRKPEEFAAELAARGVRIVGMGGPLLRFVTHLDVDDEGIAMACEALLAMAKTKVK
jgi:threonine aldolase